MADGFNSWEGNAKMWKVTHDCGTTFVHALTESEALERFQAQYPNYRVKKIELL